MVHFVLFCFVFFFKTPLSAIKPLLNRGIVAWSSSEIPECPDHALSLSYFSVLPYAGLKHICSMFACEKNSPEKAINLLDAL